MPGQLHIRFFASLRERLQMQSLSLDWDAGDVSSLRSVLVSRGEAWADFAYPAKVRVAVNQVMADESTRVRPGDEVAFFPPVTGG